MHQYILLQTFPYECPWILGVFSDLDETLDYILKIEQENNDNYDEYDECDKEFKWIDSKNYKSSYRIEEWNKTKKLRTYKYNNITSLLE